MQGLFIKMKFLKLFTKNCKILLCDYNATVFVDDCENCQIFIGPCSSRLNFILLILINIFSKCFCPNKF